MLAATGAFLAACGGYSANNANYANNSRAANTANMANTNMAASDNAAAEAEVRKLMDAAQAALAKNDADAMANIYADNYMLVNLDGTVQTKAERLASLRSGDAKYTSFSYSEPNIRISPGGDDAVVIAKLSMKGSMRGKPVDGDYRVTQVYSKTKDGWKQISAQATAITAAASTLKTTASNSNTAANTAKPAASAPANKPATNY